MNSTPPCTPTPFPGCPSRISPTRCHNILSRLADGTEGWPAEAPFDRIIVTAACPEVPEPLLAQLADPGLLVMPVGDRSGQILELVELVQGEYKVQELARVRFVDLIGAIENNM